MHGVGGHGRAATSTSLPFCNQKNQGADKLHAARPPREMDGAHCSQRAEYDHECGRWKDAYYESKLHIRPHDVQRTCAHSPRKTFRVVVLPTVADTPSVRW